MKEFNPLSLQILESKYYAPGETCPEDVFRRVARAVSIPDVLYTIADIMHGKAAADETVILPNNIRDQFAPYEDTFDRVLPRLGYKIDTEGKVPEINNRMSVESIWNECYKIYYDMLVSQEFMPGTPTLINAGRPAGMLSSCFALRIPDSMEGIFDTVRDVALISKAGGGVGLDLSDLRHAGAKVEGTRGTSSGPISFLKVFDMTGQQVKQGGIRRAALLAGMRITHPDILQFIRCKEEEGTLSNFNISVFVTNEFVDAVKNNSDVPWVCTERNCQYVLDKNTGEPMQYETRMKNEDYYTAKELWNVVVEHAWRNGEPGIIFEDELNRGDAFNGKYGKLLVNPCVTKDTWVFTSDGPRQVGDLLHKDFLARVGENTYPAKAFFSTGVKPVIEVSTKEGFSIKLTTNHKVQRITGYKKITPPEPPFTAVRIPEYEWIPAGDLSVNDSIRINYSGSSHWEGRGTEDEGYLLGLLIGDGHFSYNDSEKKNWTGAVCIWDHEYSDEWGNKVLEIVSNLTHRPDFSGFQYVAKDKKRMLKLSAIYRLADSYGIKPTHKTVTADVERASREFYVGVLRGLFDADGSVQGTHKKGVSVRLNQSNKLLLQRVQRMLQRLGIFSKVYLGRKPEGYKALPDGNGGEKEYWCKENHELVISGEDLQKYQDIVGFYNTKKGEKLTAALGGYKRALNKSKWEATVYSIELIGEEEVYDTTVEDIHAFDGNGIYLHNCGELPLISGESCNLGAINLRECVNEAGTAIDEQKLTYLVSSGVKFLDNIVDVNKYPLPKVEIATRRARKIGLGIMGLHDIMLMFGIEYGSQKSLELIDEIYTIIKQTAEQSSEMLGKSRGVPEELANLGIKFRNGGLLTVQPTGTVSMICNQTSSAIEPVFQWDYTRKDSYGTHTIKHFIRDQFPDKLPAYAKTALEITPEAHIKVQARVQKYVDQSISKTCNLPNSATTEDVSNIYMMAYKNKCKSVTVYRSGSRQEEVLSTGEKDAKVKEEKAPKKETRMRPRILYGATYRINTPGGKAYITVNEDPEGIREVFVHISKAGSEIGTHIEAEGRLISNSLKRRVPVQEIIDHLTDHKSNPIMDNGTFVKSVPDAVAKVMRHFNDNLEGFSEFLERTPDAPSVYNNDKPVKENYENLSGDLCPDCGSVMYMASGCSYCSCGHSTCG